MANHRADRRGSGRRPSETPAPGAAVVGRRRATRVSSGHTASRGSLFRGVPSVPILLGVAALAVSAGGAVTAASPDLVGSSHERLSQASALTGASAVSRANLLDARDAAVSRDSARDAMADKADEELVDLAENQARQRNVALARFAKQAEAQAAKIALNQWVLPLAGYRLTSTFGEVSSLWATFHTGLDFAAPSGTPLVAIANAVVTSVGYDGSYGNKTVLTLEDGTEVWYCHQTSFAVSEGQVVDAGEVIGSVGATGNVTGPHLHLEVRPGGGDPVDPYEALAVRGIQP